MNQFIQLMQESQEVTCGNAHSFVSHWQWILYAAYGLRLTYTGIVSDGSNHAIDVFDGSRECQSGKPREHYRIICQFGHYDHSRVEME